MRLRICDAPLVACFTMITYGCEAPPTARREPTAESPPSPVPAPSASVSAEPVQECATLKDCVLLAHQYRTGRNGVAQDSTRALALFERACSFTKGADDAGCRQEAFMLRVGEGVPQDEAKALGIYERLCARGAGAQCVTAGRLLAAPKQLRRDEAAAARFRQQGFELLSKACDAGRAYECNSLGWMHFAKEAPGATPQQATDAFQKSCARKHVSGCDSYAFMLLNGVGVTKDEPEAFRLYTYACKGNVGYACIARGFMLQFGRGTDANQEEAAAAFKAGCSPHVFADLERSCNRDADPWSCGMASLTSAMGVCTAKDVGKSRTLSKNACQPGYAWYCDRLREVEKPQRK